MIGALGIWNNVSYIRKTGSRREVDGGGEDTLLEWESRDVHAFPTPENVNAGVAACPSAIVCICLFVFSTVDDGGLSFSGVAGSGA